MDNLWFYLFLAVTICFVFSIFLIYRKYLKLTDGIQKSLKRITKGQNDKTVLNEIENKRVLNRLKFIKDHGKSINDKYRIVEQIMADDEELEVNEIGEDDKFTQLLVNLHNKLKDAKKEEEKRRVEEEKHNWSTKGEAMFGEILRNSNIELKELSYMLMKNLVNYTKSIQGAIYVEVGEGDDKIFELKSAIAYDRHKLLDIKFKTGESLVGRCAFEKETVYLEDVPQNYVNITSGLGDSNPTSLLLVPAKVDDEVNAVIELASFNKFEPFEIKFIEKIGTSIAATISTVKTTERTIRLLEQSKAQSEEMASQEEELRQNLEELQATQEEVERLRTEDKRRNEEMIQEVELHRKTLVRILDHIPGKIFLKDDDCRMLIVNKEVLEAHNATEEELLGKNDFDFIEDKDEAQEYYDAEQEIISTGKPLQIVQKEVINDTGMYLDSLKIPFYIDYLGVTGILGFQKDITELVELREKVEELQKKLKRYE